MAEAAHAVLTAYFNHPDAAPMWSGYITGNTRSAALLHRTGFSTTGMVTQHHSRALHAVVNIRQMILSTEQWHAVNPVEITTPRVRLRPLRPADVPDLVRIAGNDQVAPMMGSVTSPWPAADVLRWIETRRWRGHIGFCLGIYLPDGALIGAVALGGTPVNTAYFLTQSQWGRGLMTETMAAFLRWAFALFDLAEVTAGHFDDNPMSGRVLRKLGFVKTGSAMQASAARSAKTPPTTYRLLHVDLMPIVDCA